MKRDGSLVHQLDADQRGIHHVDLPVVVLRIGGKDIESQAIRLVVAAVAENLFAVVELQHGLDVGGFCRPADLLLRKPGLPAAVFVFTAPRLDVEQRLELLESDFPRSGDLSLTPDEMERLAGRIEIEGEPLVDAPVLVMRDQFVGMLDVRFQRPPPAAPSAGQLPGVCYVPLSGLSRLMARPRHRAASGSAVAADVW